MVQHKTRKQELGGGRYCTCIGRNNSSLQCRSSELGHGACMKSMSRCNTMQGFVLTATEKCILVIDSIMERKMQVMGKGSWCMLEEYVKDNYYIHVRFHTNVYKLTLDNEFLVRIFDRWEAG